MAHLLMHHI